MGQVSHNVISGFEKRADLANSASNFASLMGGISGLSTGAGIGFLARSKFQDYLKDKRDRNAKDKFLASAPVSLGLSGALLGGLASRRQYKKILKPLSGTFDKAGSLKKNVVLRDHQERALDKADQNDGNLLVAHATGSGKTLTGIAAFEKAKERQKGKKALVVVPAGLRENFIENGVKKFTNSSVSMYGPKGEKKSKSIGDKSSADYNVVSYELFREHGDKLIEDTGADTLIMDEIHRVRGTEGLTYNKIRDLRPKFKNAITLTGSIVNNNPNDVVPLLDITYKPTGHKLISKKFFDKLFVQSDAKARGVLNPKVYVEKRLKNQKQLGKYISNKVDFISHKDLEEHLPDKVTNTIEVPMSKDQQRIYDFTMTSVDPVTRWKIKNNIPVGQREAKDAFSKLLQARQVATDPAVLDKTLRDKNPMEYSNKINRIVTDAKKHLDENKNNRTVIYSNLIRGQLEGVEKALKSEGVDFAKFVGAGQPGVTTQSRDQAIRDFNANKKRVLLLSGAGAEGLDLKNATMMQMVEGHYNPERIQQAEARVRRMGAFADLPKEQRKVTVNRYVSKPLQSTSSKLLGSIGMKTGDRGVDEWIYNIAEKKDSLNSEFRKVLSEKSASYLVGVEKKATDSSLDHLITGKIKALGQSVGGIPGSLIYKALAKQTDAKVEEKIKQELLNRGKEEFLQKKHYSKILAESKIDEKALDAGTGTAALMAGLTTTGMAYPLTRKSITEQVAKMVPAKAKGILPKIDESLAKIVPKKITNALGNRLAGRIARLALVGVGTGLALDPLAEKVRQNILTGSISADSPNLTEGLKRYETKLRKKLERKYKNSKNFINEFDTKKELGIDVIS